MAIMVKQVRINNFRSLASIDVTLGMTNVLIGQNNSGKSNFLKAIDIALNGNRTISEQDIFVKEGERLTSDKTAIIDLLIVPTDDNDKQDKHFTDFWTGVFTDKWITTDETNGDFVGIRTVISLDIKRNDYSPTRKPIKEWNASIDKAVCGKKQQFGMDIAEYMNSFFMDAHRDVSDDIKNKKSYFGRATSLTDLSDELIDKLEKQLNDVNGEIIKNIPALKQTADRISAIGNTLGNHTSTVQIEPLTRKISDLHKGMDVTFKDGIGGASFSISQHGLGTRSWISFLTLGAYVDWFSEKIKTDDAEAESFVMLTMEEPEAHLHPQAQRHLYSQIVDFNGQKIVSTHSPNVLAQAEISDIIHFYKTDGETNAIRFNMVDYTEEEINRIKREVINTRGELLFSSALVLCEGITEEQALPIYFKEYFGMEPIFCGVSIIGIGGQNYKSFLKLIKDFSIKWFIFSDGETKTVKTVKKAVKIMTESDISALPNVVILENEEDYEHHLLASGYGEMMIAGIIRSEDCVSDEDSADSESKDVNNDTYFEKYIKITNHTSCGRYKTDNPPCETCKQDIYEDNIRDYNGSDGYNRAIYDCCTGKNSKARYARYIAEEIILQGTGIDKIPPKVRELLKEIAQQLNIKVRSDYHEA
jgi:putative ATP-dependent endonuclease of OLD family